MIFVTSSWAQQPDSQPLTLAAALSYAHAHSPLLAGTKQDVETQQAGVKTAEAERLPRVDFGTALRGSNLRTQTALGFPLTPFADLPQNQPFSHGHLVAGVFATLPIYTGGRIRSATRLAQANRQLAQASVRDVERNLDFKITSTYAQIVELDRDVQAAEESVKALTESLRVIDQMLSVGKVARVDRLKVFARLADVRSTLIDFSDAREIQAGQLNALMGRAPGTPVVVERALPQQPAPVPREQLAPLAVTGNTKVQVAEAQLNVAERSVNAAKSELRPSLSLAANFIAQGADPFSAYKGGAIGGVVFSFPLFDRTLNHEVQKAKSRELEHRDEVAQAKLDAMQRARTAYLQIQDAEERIRATQAAIASAREALRVEQQKERYGRTIIENVLDAQAALLTSQADYYRALADHTIAVAALKRETGR
ncbi:MAG: TolC family protein [Acidobacteriota bacterium]|nr:TolC family protein [Acidobacteriota bacterium]